MSNQDPITLIPVSTNSAINPTSPAPLTQVSGINAVYSEDTNSLSVNCTVSLPKGLNAATSVSIEQYFDPSSSNVLSFFVVLNSTSSSCVNNQVYFFDALSSYSGGEIDLAAIENVEFIVVNKTPVTSRKVSSSVVNS